MLEEKTRNDSVFAFYSAHEITSETKNGGYNLSL
jgi:hypothetical protein